jgi:DNA-binding transcriptional LysR family regulator
MDNLDQLKPMGIFAAVAEAGGFTAAARRLGLTKAQVSRRVAELERGLGLRLLTRTTRRVKLTEPGQSFYAACRRMLDEATRARAVVQGAAGDVAGLLRISAPVSLGAEHVVPIVAELARRHPRLEVQIDLDDREVNMIEEGYDVAVRFGILRSSSLIARHLAAVRSVVCGAPAYFAARGTPRSPQALARHDWVVYTGISSQLTFARGRQRRSVRVRGRLRTNNGNSAKALLLQGHGLTLAPLWHVRDDLAHGRLAAVLTDWRVRDAAIYALYRTPSVPFPKSAPVSIS